jgi:hypothetical protein
MSPSGDLRPAVGSPPRHPYSMLRALLQTRTREKGIRPLSLAALPGRTPRLLYSHQTLNSNVSTRLDKSLGKPPASAR